MDTVTSWILVPCTLRFLLGVVALRPPKIHANPNTTIRTATVHLPLHVSMDFRRCR